MTKIGQSLIDEYINEVNERIDDDKRTIRFNQGLTTVKSILLYTLKAIPLTTVALLAFVLVLFLLDESVISALRTATDADITRAVASILAITIAIAMIATMMVAMFHWNTIVGDQLADRINAEQAEARLLARIVEVQEELLIRHHLIEGESHDGT